MNFGGHGSPITSGTQGGVLTGWYWHRRPQGEYDVAMRGRVAQVLRTWQEPWNAQEAETGQVAGGWEQGQAEVGRDGGCHSDFTYIYKPLLTLSDTGAPGL